MRHIEQTIQKPRPALFAAWAGGEPPAAEFDKVTVILGNGLGWPCRAGDLDWSTVGTAGSVIAWRLGHGAIPA